jgi:hypothetical protein
MFLMPAHVLIPYAMDPSVSIVSHVRQKQVAIMICRGGTRGGGAIGTSNNRSDPRGI